MRVNPLFRSLLDKSVGSMLSAIEIYNKPDFNYREESFAILSVNSWELLLKAYLLKINHFNVNSLYVYKDSKKKDGTPSKRKVVALNRCNNPCTLSIQEVINRLSKLKHLPSNLKSNIETLIELRDNAIHFTNLEPITKQIQELGFACIKNYISIVKYWKLPIDFSRYNLYLMPLAYIDSKKIVDSVLSKETENYIDLVKSKISSEDQTEEEFNIAISIDIDFKKGNSFESIGVYYSPDGTPITVSEENIKKNYPYDYKVVVKKCKEKYSDFKQDRKFNDIMKGVKQNKKLCHIRKLDTDNPKSLKKEFYSTAIFIEFDKHYHRKDS